MRVGKLGFRLGGHAGYGLRRLLVDQNRAPKCILGPGEWKIIPSDHVVLVPGPPEEVEVVRWIYSSFVHERKSEFQIASILNERNLLNHLGRPWRVLAIRYLLKSEKYIGNYVWNRKSFKLKKAVVRNTPDCWLRAEGAFEAIIPRPLFDAAQEIFRTRSLLTNGGRPRDLSDEEMLERLSQVLRAEGRLSRPIINHAHGLPSYWSYKVRFGDITKAYRLVGFTKGSAFRDRTLYEGPRLDDKKMLDALKRLYKGRGYLSNKLIDECKCVPSVHAFCSHFGSISQAYKFVGYKSPFEGQRRRSSEQMLVALKRLADDRGDLSRKIINEADGVPPARAYNDRFGGLIKAYKLIGFKPRGFKYIAKRGVTNEQMLEDLQKLLGECGYLSCRLIEKTGWMPSRTLYINRFGTLRRAYEIIGYEAHGRFRGTKPAQNRGSRSLGASGGKRKRPAGSIVPRAIAAAKRSKLGE